MAEEFFSFEKALEKLKLREEELRRLVSEGEIRAYRSGETMKLRKEDVEKLQKELSIPSTGDVVDVDAGAEELIFSEEEPTEIVEETGMETAPISEEDTLVIEETNSSGEEINLEEPVATRTPAPARRARAGARSTQTALAEVGGEGAFPRFLMITTGALLLVSSFALINVASMEKSAPNSFFKSIGGMFFGQ